MEQEYFPLTFSQELMFFNQKFSTKKSVINICSAMHFDCEADKDLILQAASVAFIRNKSSSIRMHMNGKKVCQYFSEQPPEAIEVVDFSGKSDKDVEKYIDKLSQTAFPNNSMDTQLYTSKLIMKPDGHYAMYFCVSHLAFDAYSLMQMASDMLNIYVCLRDGKALPANKNNPIPSFRQDWDYPTSTKHQDDVNFWNDVFADEPRYSTINGMKSKEWIKGKRYGKSMSLLNSKAKHANHVLSKELAEAVRDFASGIKVSPQCVYMLGIRSYLSKNSGFDDDICMVNTIARRATKIEKNAGGTRVMGTYFRMNFPNSLTFREACGIMQTKQYQYYAHSSLPTPEIIKIMKTKHNTPPIRGYAFFYLTYQPYMVANQDSVPVHFTVHSNGATVMPIYLTIMALDNSGNLNCCYEYNVTYADEKRIEKLHNYLIKFLETAVKNPDITLEELMKI